VLAGVPLLPVKIPYSVEATGTLFPARRWALTRGTDDFLVGGAFDYATGMTEGYSISQFERGESVRIDINPDVFIGSRVAVGDTVATVSSTEAQERLAELTGQLAIARATLAAGSSGEKESLVQAAEQRLSQATAAAAQQHRELARLEQLFENGVVTAQEYEAAGAQAYSLDVEVSIAQSQLEVASSGEKPELIGVHRSNVEALSQQIRVLDHRLASFTITSPIEGTVSRVFSPDTLLLVTDESLFVVLIPVRWLQYPYVSEARLVDVEIRDAAGSLTAELVSFRREIQHLGGHQALVATALLRNPPDGLMPGMVARCVFRCEPISIFVHLRRMLRSAWV